MELLQNSPNCHPEEFASFAFLFKLLYFLISAVLSHSLGRPTRKREESETKGRDLEKRWPPT